MKGLVSIFAVLALCVSAYGQGSTGSGRVARFGYATMSYGSNGSYSAASYGSNGSAVMTSYGSNGSGEVASYGSNGSFSAGPVARFGSALVAGIQVRRAALAQARAERFAARSAIAASRTFVVPASAFNYVEATDCIECTPQAQYVPMLLPRAPMLMRSACTCVDCQCPNCDCGQSSQSKKSDSPVVPEAPVLQGTSDATAPQKTRQLKKLASHKEQLTGIEELLVALVK